MSLLNLDYMLDRLSTRELWFWCLLFAAVACFFETLGLSDGTDPLRPAEMFQSLVDSGAFTLAAWVMIFARVGRLGSGAPAAASASLAAFLAALLALVPARQATTVLLAGLGAALLPLGSRGGGSRPSAAPDAHHQVGVLLLALAFVWASSRLLEPLHMAVAAADAHGAAALLHFAGISAAARGNLIARDGFVLEVLIRCSSSSQFADISLAFAVVAIFFRGRVRVADWRWLLPALAAVVILNLLRLSLMALGPDDYEWWHHGTGSTLYGTAVLIITVGAALMAVWRDA